MRTNTNKYKANIKQYLLDCINYDETETFSDSDKLKGGNVNLLLEGWLSGLAIGIDFEYNSIIKAAKMLHETDYISDKKMEIIQRDWFKHLAQHLNRIFEQNQKDWFVKNYK